MRDDRRSGAATRTRTIVSAAAVVLASTLAFVGVAASLAAAAEDGVFVGDFEVSSPGWQQFTGLQYEEDRPLGDSFTLTGSPARQGTKSARIVVRQGYSKWGHNEDTELVWRGGEQEGDEYWYAWSTQFPTDWEAPSRWGIFAQWHANLGTSPILSFNARSDTASFNLLSGLADEDRNRMQVERGFPLLGTLSKGRWNDFVLHVRWSTQAEGFVEVYHRVEGSPSLRRLLRIDGIPTFQFTREGKGLGTYLLFGLYRASLCPQPTQISCSGAPSTQQPNVLYHDGFTRAPTYESAARSAFPAPLPKLVLTGSTESGGTEASKLTLTTRSKQTGRETDSGCRSCSVVAAGNRIVATVAGPSDARDTAVAVYPVTQRSTIVVRQKLRLAGPKRIAGNVVVTQLRHAGRVLAEVYVTRSDGMLRLFSPTGVLWSDGLNLESDATMRPGSPARLVELRLGRGTLMLIVDGKVRIRQDGVAGPARGARVVVRVGIDHYDGNAGGALRTIHDAVAVGAADASP